MDAALKTDHEIIIDNYGISEPRGRWPAEKGRANADGRSEIRNIARISADRWNGPGANVN